MNLFFCLSQQVLQLISTLTMEDVLTELPPPSRFFEEDLNNFVTPSPPHPSPFFQFLDPKTNGPLRPSLLIIALSPQSLYIFHHIKSKTLIGSLVIPDNPSSSNPTQPSHGDKTCNIYSLAGNSIILVTVQCPVSAERCHSISKMLIGEEMVLERVLILASVQSRNFRGRLSPDETFALKLETSSERLSGDLSLLKGLDYFPSGSMIDGLAAALLSQCEMKNIKGALCVSWPEFGTSVVSLLKSLLQKNVLPNLDFSSNVGSKEELRSFGIKDHPFASDLYTWLLSTVMSNEHWKFHCIHFIRFGSLLRFPSMCLCFILRIL